jgi:hypothetical protein
LLLVTLIALEYGLFRQYALREVTWAYPINHDQVQYLSQSYETFERILADGLWHGLGYGVGLSPPQGMLIHLQASLLFLLIGASRLSALTLNFVYWALFQGVLVGTLKWLTRGWSIPFLGLALLLTLGTPFFWAGGLMDFRLDFIAFCLMGIFICVVMRSGIFASMPWSLAAGGVAAYCVLFRFITLAYLVVMLGITLAFLCLRLWLSRRDASAVRSRGQIRGLLTAGVLMAVLVGPGLWLSRRSLQIYYAGAQLQEAQSRAQEQGISSTWDAIGFYPRSIMWEHAGPPWLILAGLTLTGTFLLARGAGRGYLETSAPPAAQVPLIDLPAAYVFLGASLIGPLIVLIPNTAKSPVVGGITVPALIWLVLLAVATLAVRARSAVKTGLTLFAVVSLLYGVGAQFGALARRGELSRHRADVEQVLQLYDAIARYCLRVNWTRPVISTDTISDHLNAGIPEPLIYERQGWILRPRSALGGIPAIDPDRVLSLFKSSDFVILTSSRAARPSDFPFDRSIRKLRPRLRDLCERDFVRLEEYRIYDRLVTLYVRPSVALEGDSGGWITSQGLAITGAAAVLRARPTIELRGSTPFEYLGGRVPGVEAAIAGSDGAGPDVSVKLTAAGQSYRMITRLDPKRIDGDGWVRIRIRFDSYFVPKDIGVNEDTRQLVIATPQQVELFPPGGPDNAASTSQPDRPRVQRGS